MLTLMRGGSFVDIWPSIVAPVAIGAALFAVGVWRLRWQ
jgi:hypothetical protein